MNTDDITKILQGSIAPSILISGVGLLLLSMTNRLARSIDRARELCKEIQETPGKDHASKNHQVDILYRRCLYLQTAIALITTTIICVSIIILALFSMFVFRVNLIYFVQILFTVGLLALIVSLLLFLRDISLGLKSVKIEIEETRGR